MKAFLECISCIIRQTIEILRRNVKSEKQRQKILAAVVKKLSKINIYKMTPPEATKYAHDEIQRLTGIKDLYKEPKKQNNREAMRLYPYLKKLVKKASDPEGMEASLTPHIVYVFVLICEVNNKERTICGSGEAFVFLMIISTQAYSVPSIVILSIKVKKN